MTFSDAVPKKSWDRSKELVIFDELHKLKNWKSWIKGIYDTEGIPPSILVTGSAKLDTYRKVGDSLAGRFFQFRLHPLDLKEINTFLSPKNLESQLDKLLTIGGFPEPFLLSIKILPGLFKKQLNSISMIQVRSLVIQVSSCRTQLPVLYKKKFTSGKIVLEKQKNFII